MRIYNCTVSEPTALCNTAINIANIESGKIARVYTHNSKCLDFHRSSRMLYYSIIKIHNYDQNLVNSKCEK